jgi:hypothetical protein
MIKKIDNENEKSVTTTVPLAPGGGFCGLLTIAFIVLKLLGVISWSWLWVLAPLWIPLLISLGIIIVALIVTLIVWIINR